MASRQRVREESWNSLHSSEATEEMEDSWQGGDSSYEQNIPKSALLTIKDVQRAIHPLQEAADRVGKQVELFAESLDRLGAKARYKSYHNCLSVLPLAREYTKIAHDTVKRLQKHHGPQQQENLRKSFRRSRRRSSSGASSPIEIHEDGHEIDMNATTPADLERWEQEYQTWQLFSLHLEIQFSPRGELIMDSPERYRRPAGGEELHRYSPESTVWKDYLATDDDAWERHLIVEWLKDCSETSRPDVDTMVHELESKANTGSGLWLHGWLHTKEALKGQKRLRSWPQPLDPTSPSIDASIIGSSSSKGLITQLDPDAVTRQDRKLDCNDVSFEQGLWLGCWEMLRRGKNWETIRQWCKERVEGWRAVSVRGDPRMPQGAEQWNSDSLTGWQSRFLWRRICSIASKDGGTDKYEKAVYGMLGGDLQSVLDVATTWDDYLFAYMNTDLMHGFDKFVLADFPDLIPFKGAKDLLATITTPDIYPDNMQNKMLFTEIGKAAAKSPMKLLQTSLISKNFLQFAFEFGIRVAGLPNHEDISKTMDIPMSEAKQRLPFDFTEPDYDLLRMVVHMLLIYYQVLPIQEQEPHMELLLVLYIDYLGKAGKQQLLPLYASNLSDATSHICMARQLPYVTDAHERSTVVKLMRQYEMDIDKIMHLQVLQIMEDNLTKKKAFGGFPNLSILTPQIDGDSSSRSIRPGFLGPDLSQEEHDLVNAFEWYLLLDADWNTTMQVGVLIYQHFLRTKALAAGVQMSKRVTFSQISLNKTTILFGSGSNLNLNEERDGEGVIEELDYNSPSLPPRRRLSSNKNRKWSASKKRKERESMFKESYAFRDMENLFKLLDAYEQWRVLAAHPPTEAQLKTKGHPWRREIKYAYEVIAELIQPFMKHWFSHPQLMLSLSMDDRNKIRAACLPEILLAYNSVLNFMGHCQSREILLKCMDLAASIAAEESGLSEPFMMSGRMPELVNAMSISSRSLLKANERGPSKMSAKALDGKVLDLWTVKSFGTWT